MVSNDLFVVQPAKCRLPLTHKEFSDSTPEYIRRLLEFDPSEIYSRIRFKVDGHNRYNYVNFTELFPAKEGVCACGCGKATNDTYYDKECQFFAIAVWEVIGGRQSFLGEVFKYYNGHDLCMECNERRFVDIDHIYPVSSGGGGCWLSNFQPLCKKCHKQKTRDDFGWTKLKSTKDE